MNSQQYALLADDAYNDHSPSSTIVLEGSTYKVLAHADMPSGYQGTIYQQVDTGEIIVAHRGTDFGHQFGKDLLYADGAMLLSRVNPQARDAVAFTARALEFARQSQQKGAYAEVTVTGHSLGGTLAQITSHDYNLRGETFNAYGAVGLGYRIPAGGDLVTNHVMAADMVSAASPHFGRVVTYATPAEIGALSRAGYSNGGERPLPAASLKVVSERLLGSHAMSNFTHQDGDHGPRHASVLDGDAAMHLAARNARMIAAYRDDVGAERHALTRAAGGGPGLLREGIEHLRGPVEPGAPSGRRSPRLEDRPIPGMPPGGPDLNRLIPPRFGMAEPANDPARLVDALLAAAARGDDAGFRTLTHAAADHPAARQMQQDAIARADAQLQVQAPAQVHDAPVRTHGALRLG